MIAVRLFALIVALALGVRAARAEPRCGVSASLGAAWNLPTPLTIRQAGFADLRVKARYDGQSFRRPWYYALRVERTDRGQGWALAFFHHKLQLTNPPAGVEEFSVSHGFNLLILERSWRERGVRRSLGCGMVIAHPENVVRGKKLPERGGFFGGGYHASGALLSAALGREVPLRGRWFLPLEGRATVAWARVPVVDGRASVPNLALHALAGIGWR
jgi:hypothetical protein